MKTNSHRQNHLHVAAAVRNGVMDGLARNALTNGDLLMGGERMKIEEKTKAAATIFAGMCSNPWIVEWAKNEQTAPSKGQWHDILAKLSVEVVRKIKTEVENKP